MEYIKLFYFNRRLLCFGIVLTFFSCFGKTFLISQYIPLLQTEFHLSNTLFGSIYALVTVLSGISIIYLGQLLDKTDLKKYALFVTFGLALSCLLLSFAHNIIILSIALFGLRLSGQGLMNHTSMTAINRFFKRCRGKALSITVLGHSMGEAVLPFASIILISALGWRYSLAISAIFILILLVPLITSVLKSIPKANESFIERTARKKKNKIKERWSVKKILGSSQFYLLAPNIFIVPFVSTTLLFYLHPFATHKNWSPEWISICFLGFAVCNFTSSLFSGYFIDRFKAVNLFTLNMIPLILALTCSLFFQNQFSAMMMLCLAGASNGFNLNIENAILTEIYGVRYIATVKSVYSTLTIIASAMGPLLVGLLLDNGISFEQICFGGLIILSILTVNSLRGSNKKHKSVPSVWSIPKVILYRKGY